MKVTLNWLKEYVPFDGSPEELSERLTMLGLEVEGVEKLGGVFTGIVVGEVLTREKHPNADKLSVCLVKDGAGQRQIVCGAQNFKPGDRVALILPGNALPMKPGDKEPFVIKVGKIRGVESHGMLCSAEELGIDPEAIGLKKEDGILILDNGATAGTSFATYLGREGADVVYDLEVTPNRPDLNGVLGIAREIAAVTGNALTIPETPIPQTSGAIQDLVTVTVEARDLCPRYTARVVRGVKVGPSPAWLRHALENLGLRSINNVVDITNYVMLVTGQPLHAFDLARIARGADGKPAIVVRRARQDEKLTTLDGKERVLETHHLLIADAEKGIALAGVMGGQNSEVTAETTELLIESAYFEPTGIRRTSKALGLRTDASYRFERGADPGGAEWAGRFATALILREIGGQAADGVIDVYPTPAVPRRITLRHARVNELLGITLKPEEIEAALAQLGLKSVNRRPRALDDPGPPEPLTVQVPTYRVDLKREVDLIEEVVRLHGVDRIPSSAEPRYAKGNHPFDSRYDDLMVVRRLLTGLGLSETQGQTLISRTVIPGSEAFVQLANPLSSDMDTLRPSLLPGLLAVARQNVRHQNGDLALFEIGRVFQRNASGGTQEAWRVALLLTGARRPRFWSGADRDAGSDASDLKGMVEEFLEHFGLRGVAFKRRGEAHSWFADSATVSLGGKVALGELGQVLPVLAREYDLRGPAFMAELDLDALLARRNTQRTFKTLPAYPAIRRDVAMIVKEATTHEAVLQAVREAKAPNLEAVELFDVFRGSNVPEGFKSVAYAFTYRSQDKTLTDTEANSAHERVLARLQQSIGAQFR